ncbi:hypothetical protein AVEN_126846-1 [Araneus ventricosus]|uniref:Uncharacterized protein n=1 Tax=Araneus ventricosus TaxID=182803 RepID=A0A4Y2N6G1_ARAVE|nr:hypothetical protein AVEN_126846-1 [Araneus ventricosus]
MPSLFKFRAMQLPEIGAMAKITLLHRVAYEKATPSSGLTSLGMKIQKSHIKCCICRKVVKSSHCRNVGPNFHEHFVNSTSPLMSQYLTSKVIDRIANSDICLGFQ